MTPVSIVIPAFGAAAALQRCLASLSKFMPAGCDVVVADDATPDDSVKAAARAFESALPLRYIRRARNLGFVENCNEAMRAIVPTGRDVLLLNSDTEVTDGFLEEMSAVLHLHEKHGAVSPRSNHATIFSVPMSGDLPPEDSFHLWQAIRDRLPRYQVMPTAVGFCLLIKNIVLRQLGVFDPAYSPGYNEENDLVCRMNRHGYSAVAAHRAFVFHRESASFGAERKALEERHRKLLDERYPEYARAVNDHLAFGVDPVDHFSVLWRPHRKRILVSLFHLPPVHSGTSDFALNLLLRLAPLLEREYDLVVGMSEAGRRFFAHEVTGYQHWDPRVAPGDRFDLVFKPSQIATWPELRHIVRLGGRIVYTLLDVIAARCESIVPDELSRPAYRLLLKTSAPLADRVITISEFSRKDFGALFGGDAPFQVIRPGAHPHSQPAGGSAGYVLIVGNPYHHKAVRRAVSELQGIGDLVVFGGEGPASADIRWLSSGGLSRSAIDELYDRAAVVVYPSFYEGFGMPVADALARGIPVVALDTAVARELKEAGGAGDLHLVEEPGAIRAAAARLLEVQRAQRAPRPTRALPARIRTWQDVADDYARSFDEVLTRDLNLDLIRRRWELINTIDVISK